jgi:hypothetical protein
MRHRSLLLPSLACLLILGAASPISARSPITIGIVDPDGGSLEASATLSVVDGRAAATGTSPRLWALWSKWGARGEDSRCDSGENCAFPTATVEALQAQGVTPVIWWLPMTPGDRGDGTYSRYRRILAGRHDAYIRAWAQAARAAGEATGRPIVLRFAHEATGKWFAWSIHRFDNSRRNYLAAWRYIWKIFRAQGALEHVRFMWATVWPKEWAYPGDRYVDYVGITVLNFGAQRRWKSAEELLRNRVRASLLFTKKPIFVAEMASHYRGGDKARWLKEGYVKAYRKHPKVAAIMYLDTDEPHREAGQPDWRLVLPRDGSAMAAYRAIAASAKFKGRIR